MAGEVYPTPKTTTSERSPWKALQLPIDVVSMVMGFPMDLSLWRVARRVCKSWRQTLGQLVLRLRYPLPPVMEPLSLNPATFRRVRVLDLSHCPPEDAERLLQVCCEMPLARLDVGMVGESGILHISRCERLVVLNTGRTRFTVDGLRALWRLKQLVWLHMTDSYMRAVTSEMPPVLDHLQSLDLGKLCHRGSELWLARLADMPKLRSVTLGSALVSDLGMNSLMRATQVQRLSLMRPEGCRESMDGEMLQRIACFTQLLSLSLERRMIHQNAGGHLAVLQHLKQLRHLSLASTRTSDEDLQHLATLLDLEDLDLNTTRVSGPGLQHLHALRKLAALNLSRAPLTVRAMELLGSFQAMTQLQLGFVVAEEKWLEHLKGLRQLCSLDLSGCRELGNGAVPYLTALQQLTALWLRGTSLYGHGLEQLLQGVPGLKALDLEREAVGPEGCRGMAAAVSASVPCLDQVRVQAMHSFGN